MHELLQAELSSLLCLGLRREEIRKRKRLIALLLGVEIIFLYCQPIRLCAGTSMAYPHPRREALETSKAGRSAIQAALEHVSTPNLQVLASALGITAPEIGSEAFGTVEVGMEVIGNLDGDKVPEVAVNWKPPEHGGNGSSPSEPSLYLLSWNGKAWQASHLTNVENAFELEVLPGAQGPARFIAVVVFQGITAAPYPIIFQFRDHAARKLWDGRSDSSLYTGYDYGAVQFKKSAGEGVPEMIASGRADPGLLVFPKRSEINGRGFQETTLYAWKDNAYVPVRTEFTPNKDYTLYRFIAALHLHNFPAAYSLINPQQFLKTDKPSLKVFHERIEKDWPEFLDDKIFHVPVTSGELGNHAFTLTLQSGKTYVYLPSFTASPAYLLTGLERKESSE